MAKHRAKARARKHRQSRAKKVRAISMASVLAGGSVLAPYAAATQPVVRHVLADVLLTAGSVIFIDGNNYPDGSTRMAGEIDGEYSYQGCTSPCTLSAPPSGTTLDFINSHAVYPGTLGIYNGAGAASGDQSVADGQNAVLTQIGTQTGAGNTPITVVAYSEGAVVGSHEVSNSSLPSDVNFVLIADPERPNGGILARLPAGLTIPGLGITGGGATSSTGAPVVMVTQQYDGIADAPAYPLNAVSDVNAVLGAFYLHGKYEPVDPNAPGNIVTSSGDMTDILVPVAPGALPILMPLKSIGVLQPELVALDPALRAIIETGYDRTANPAQQVRFALLPPPSALPGDAEAIVVGVLTTAVELPGAVVTSVGSAAGLPLVAAVSHPAVQQNSTLQAPAQNPTPQPNSDTALTAASDPSVTPAPSTGRGPSSPPAPLANTALRTGTNPPATTSGNKFTPLQSAATGALSSAHSFIQGAATGISGALSGISRSLAGKHQG